MRKKIQPEYSISTVLNLYGTLSCIALIISILTVPISLDENLNLYNSEERKMKPKEIKEFLTFIICSSIIYFLFVNRRYIRKLKGNSRR